MKEYSDILSKCNLFCGIDKLDEEKMLACLCASVKNFEKEEFIFSAGNIIDEIFIVLVGSVLVINEDYWGNRTIISKIGPGQIFGESYSCLGAFAPVSAVANKSCEVMFLNVKKILTTCKFACSYHSKLRDNLVTALASKNITLNEKMSHISKRTTRDKLLSYLSECSKTAKSPSFELNFSRQELADYLCVDRSAMTSELTKLRKENMIEFEKNSFTLK